MLKKSPLPYLAGSLAAYFGLWLAIPKSRFLVSIINAIDAAIKTTHQPWTAMLALCGIVVLSIPTVAFMAAQIAVVYYFCKQRLNLTSALLWLVGSFAAVSLTVTYILWRVHIVAALHRLPTAREVAYVVSMSRFGVTKMLMYAGILLIACSIGYLVSLRIRDKNLLLPVVMFAACIDFWTVTVGPVNTMMKKMPEIVSAVSTPIPQAGTGAFIPAVMMGIGDPLLIAVVFAAIHRLGMNGRRNYWFVCAIMTAAMLSVRLDWLPYLPALTALAVAVVAANWREFKLSREEKVSTAIVAAVLLASIPLVWSLTAPKRSTRPEPRAPVSSPTQNR